MANDYLIESMFDEVTEVTVQSDGEVEVTPVYDAKQVEDAVADFIRFERDFREINSRRDAATDPSRFPGMEWWKRLAWLSLADDRLKDIFCGRDRSPRSIATYRKLARRRLVYQWGECPPWLADSAGRPDARPLPALGQPNHIGRLAWRPRWCCRRRRCWRSIQPLFERYSPCRKHERTVFP